MPLLYFICINVHMIYDFGELAPQQIWNEKEQYRNLHTSASFWKSHQTL